MVTITGVSNQKLSNSIPRKVYAVCQQTNDGTVYELIRYPKGVINSLERANEISKSRGGELITWGEKERVELSQWVKFHLKDGEWVYVANEAVKDKQKYGYIQIVGKNITQIDKMPNRTTTKVFLKLTEEEALRRDHRGLLRDYALEEAYG